jgi:redox-sensitive bicupin YhaK (pirin superfamily)
VYAGRPRDGAVEIRADADVFVGRLDAGARVTHATSPRRGLWLHGIAGSVRAAGEEIGPGDGLAVEGAQALEIEGSSDAEFLLFDLK